MSINNIAIVCCRRTGSSVTMESLWNKYELNNLGEYFTDDFTRDSSSFLKDIKDKEKNIVKFIINHPKMTSKLFDEIKEQFDVVLFIEREDICEMIVSDLLGSKTGGNHNNISPQNFFDKNMIDECMSFYNEYLSIRNKYSNPNVIRYESIHEDLKKVFGEDIDFGVSKKKKLFTKNHKLEVVLDYKKIENYISEFLV